MGGRSWDEEPRDFYGFVDGIHENDPADGYARIVLHLDCVDADSFDRSPDTARDPERLALIRVVPTWRALFRHFCVDNFYRFDDLIEGRWVALHIQTKPWMPRAWVLPASQEYRRGAPTNLVSLRLLADGDPVADKLANASRFLQTTPQRASLATAFQQHGRRLSGNLRIEALDVGQASSAVFISNGTPIGFFDVGAPIWFNQKSMPSGYTPPPVAKGFVMLSHWDFDHIDQARRFPTLRQLEWFAPDQTVGFNTRRLQDQIGSNLTFVHGAATFQHRIQIAPGTSSNPGDRNGTGYAMRVEHGNEVAVLLGDSDYQFVQPSILTGATALTVPHHGGRGTLPPAPAGGSALAIASYGNPNSYRHPHEPHLADHVAVGWSIARTATHPPTGVARGNRRLL